MEHLKDFEYVGTRAFYRPVSVVTLEQGVELVAEALKRARALGITDVMVNILGLTGFNSPDVFGRYELATKWLQSAGAAMRVAIVARADLIDPQKIGILVYQNRGGSGEVFPTESEALAWLDAAPGSGRYPAKFPDQPPALR